MRRVVDIVAASLLLVVHAPLMLVLAGLIRWRMGSPVMFRQRRAGRNGVPFRIYKFRTMLDRRDASGALLADEERLTPFGQWIRRMSLDELPQLLNVLRGDMTFIGPRPLLVEYNELYTPEQRRRLAVTPGITGWAQVNGRDAITWDEKFALDLEYLERRSTLMDLRILWLTLRKVVVGEGASPTDRATMEDYRDYIRRRRAEVGAAEDVPGADADPGAAQR